MAPSARSRWEKASQAAIDSALAKEREKTKLALEALKEIADPFAHDYHVSARACAKMAIEQIEERE